MHISYSSAVTHTPIRFNTIDEIKDREQKREWAEQERKWRLEKMRKGQLEEMKLLEQAVMDWDKAEKIRSFADRMEKEINNVEDIEKKNRLIGISLNYNGKHAGTDRMRNRRAESLR